MGVLIGCLTISSAIGYFCGWLRGRFCAKLVEREDRRRIYCAGWQDSLFHAIGEYDPRYYIEQRAFQSFEEYESCFKKPEPH